MRFTTDTTLYAHWVQNDVSGWTLASELPAGAEVVNRKWTYTLTSYTTSNSPSLSGWDRYDSSWEWGGWSGWLDWDPGSNGDRQTETQQEVIGYNKKTQYFYSRYYGWSSTKGDYVACAYKSGVCLNYEDTGWLDYSLPWEATHYFGGLGYSAFGKGWINSKNISWYNQQTQEVDDYNSPIYKTQWRYRDKIYTYYFRKHEDKESYSDPSGQINVSNVKEYVQYRMK